MRTFALDHVGIAAPAPGDHPLVRALATRPLEPREMPSGVAVARFGPEERLELILPSLPGNPIERFLERRGPGLHHVAFQVNDPLLEVLEGLRVAGLEPVGPVEPASDGRPSVFLHPASAGGVLVELVEGPRRR